MLCIVDSSRGRQLRGREEKASVRMLSYIWDLMHADSGCLFCINYRKEAEDLEFRAWSLQSLLFHLATLSTRPCYSTYLILSMELLNIAYQLPTAE